MLRTPSSRQSPRLLAPGMSPPTTDGGQPRQSSGDSASSKVDACIAQALQQVGRTGEALVDLAAGSSAELDDLVLRLSAESALLSADTTVLRRRGCEAGVLVRRNDALNEIRVCVIGASPRGPPMIENNASFSAKPAELSPPLPSPCRQRRRWQGASLLARSRALFSIPPKQSTLVGVLSRGVLDDGRGAARSKVFRHSHEQETGRTSSIGANQLRASGTRC